MAKPHTRPNPDERPAFGDLLRHRKLPITARARNWLGPNLLEVEITEVPGELQAGCPVGTILDESPDMWRIVSRARDTLPPDYSQATEPETDDFLEGL